MNPISAHLKEWLTPIDLLDLFNIKIKVQERLRAEKKIPYSKVGRQIRYKKDRIEKWLEEHTVC